MTAKLLAYVQHSLDMFAVNFDDNHGCVAIEAAVIRLNKIEAYLLSRTRRPGMREDGRMDVSVFARLAREISHDGFCEYKSYSIERPGPMRYLVRSEGREFPSLADAVQFVDTLVE